METVYDLGRKMIEQITKGLQKNFVDKTFGKNFVVEEIRLRIPWKKFYEKMM
tara:strand:- start:118 stop:273 length:156 start_codon:yes stop_codon:yes gene_type:complete